VKTRERKKREAIPHVPKVRSYVNAGRKIWEKTVTRDPGLRTETCAGQGHTAADLGLHVTGYDRWVSHISKLHQGGKGDGPGWSVRLKGFLRGDYVTRFTISGNTVSPV
jgi:hypothetical protein